MPDKVNFLDVANNAVDAKKPLPEGGEGVVWGVKRYLSVNMRLLPFVARADRYWGPLDPRQMYDLLRFTLPRINFIGKGLGKTLDEKIENEELCRMVCAHFHITVKEFPVFLDIWRNEGRSINDLMRIFGFQTDGKTKRKTKRKAKKKR